MDARDSSKTMIGRYALYAPIAAGGMATVHFGRLHAAGGFSRTVAIKRLHDRYANEPEFVARFLDEARITARIRHPNVVPTLDVVSRGRELFLVMEYAHGESLAKLIVTARELGQPVPLRIASAIMTSVLQGLHVAHEARSEAGLPLRIVHRDVSPQNVVVGSDGVTRILDFGIAKAVDRAQSTKDGSIRGKVAYMSPEQLLDAGVDHLTDVYAASVVFWELLTGERIFGDAELAVIAARVMSGDGPPLPSSRRDDIPSELDALIMKGLSHDAADRPQSALLMASEIERIVEPASASRVGAWVQSLAAEALKARAKIVADIESGVVTAEEFGEGADVSEVLVLSDSAILDSYTAPEVPVVTALDKPRQSSGQLPAATTSSRSLRTGRILGLASIVAAPFFVFAAWHVVRAGGTAPVPSPDEKPVAAVDSAALRPSPEIPSPPSPSSSPSSAAVVTSAPTAATVPAHRHHGVLVPATTALPSASAAPATPPAAATTSADPDTLYRSRR